MEKLLQKNSESSERKKQQQQKKHKKIVMGVKFFIKLFTDSSWRKKCIAIKAIFYNLAATLYRSYE